MHPKNTFFVLLAGDIFSLYISLITTLFIRYRSNWFPLLIYMHLLPFSCVFILWIAVFYIADLYDPRRLRNNLEFFASFLVALLSSSLLSVIVFYLIPAFHIAPKTNLLLFAVIFGVLCLIWRRIWNHWTASRPAPNRVLLIGSGAAWSELEAAVASHPQLGYQLLSRISEQEAARRAGHLSPWVSDQGATMVVISRGIKRHESLVMALYHLLGQGITVLDFDRFYELVMRKVPLEDIKETWFFK